MKKTIKKSMLAVGVAAGSALYGATLLAPTTFAAGIGNQVFTDANFYECVVKQYNALNPGILETTTSETVLTDAQLASISALNCDYINTDESYYEATTKITSTAGLNKLIGLKKLSLWGQGLSSIDITKNTMLKELNLSGNNLTSLYLSGQPALQTLNISDNKLTSLDLSKQTKLTVLDAHANQLISLDLSKQADLTTLEASYNKLATLDLSNQSELIILDVRDNKLAEIDLAHNTKLQSLNAFSNNLTQINVSKAPGLKELIADDITIIPATTYGTTDNCELTASLAFVGSANTIKTTDQYLFNNETHILTMKSRPKDNKVDTVNSSSSLMDEHLIGLDYEIDFGDELEAEFAKLASCEIKKEDVKVPDTGGSLSEEFDGKLIGASIAGVAVVALLGFVSAYTYNRRKNHIRF